MPYDWVTEWAGVFERHADRCSFADTGTCTCGPLGYIASIPDPDTGARVTSPMLETAAEARAWRREQELAVDQQDAAARNGNGNGRGVSPTWGEEELIPEAVAAPVSRKPRRRAAPARDRSGGQAAPTRDGNGRVPRDARIPAPARSAPQRAARSAPPRAIERPRAPEPTMRAPAPPARAAARDGIRVPALIDMFLDAAEAGEARGHDGRPYSDEQLAEFEWAFAGYVDSEFADLSAGDVRGRHIFRLIDDLEDAGMPRSRLRSVVGAVRELFDYAAELDLVRVNPATYVSLPSDDRRPRRRLAETLETRVQRTPPADSGGGQYGDNVISERAIWMAVKLVTLAFVLIALVLVAESV